ncbi:LytR/AlgR family response regulator transcription factor [Blautia pseudococcoides]|nr:response regulator [Blautia pseudococcoides]
MDIEMPGSNGLEVAHEIRSRDPAVGIIFITSLAQYAIDGYEVQGIDFMMKPVFHSQHGLHTGRWIGHFKSAGYCAGRHWTICTFRRHE